MTLTSNSVMDTLALGGELDPAERALVGDALAKTVRTLGARVDIAAEGDEPRTVKVLLDGWAMRYRSLPDGRRQILAFLIPGDFCFARVGVLRRLDHSIGTLTTARVAEIPHALVESMLDRSSRIAEAFWRGALVELSIQREWTVSLGQRSAISRVAHLLCELVSRLGARGLGGPSRWRIPITQIEIAEATGLTPVHVNRMLQQLRRDGLIDLYGRELVTQDWARLQEVGMFSPAYLHIIPPAE